MHYKHNTHHKQRYLKFSVHIIILSTYNQLCIDHYFENSRAQQLAKMQVDRNSASKPEFLASFGNSCSILSFPPRKLLSMMTSKRNGFCTIGVASGIAGKTISMAITLPCFGRARWQFLRIFMQSLSFCRWRIDCKQRHG